MILFCFDEIIATLEALNIPDAFLLLNSLQSFDFIIHLLIISEIYLLTNILSKFLQHWNISLTDTLVQVKTTVDALKSLRNKHVFERFYDEAMKMCDSWGWGCEGEGEGEGGWGEGERHPYSVSSSASASPSFSPSPFSFTLTLTPYFIDKCIWKWIAFYFVTYSAAFHLG